MRTPRSGCSRSNRSRMSRRTGISRSAQVDPADAFGGAADVGHVVGRRRSRRRCEVVGGRSPRGRRAAERGGEVGARRAQAPDEPLLEPDVLGVAETAIGRERRRVVAPDVEHDLVARAQELRGHGAGHGLGVAAAAEVDVGEHVAHDRQPRIAADDVGAGRGDELAAGMDPVVDAVGDRRRRQPRCEAELVQPVEVADVRREQPLDLGRIRAGTSRGRPTSGPSAARRRRGSAG